MSIRSSISSFCYKLLIYSRFWCSFLILLFSALFRRREHQATERDITSLTPCAEGVVGPPTTSRSSGVHSVATLMPRCAPVSIATSVRFQLFIFLLVMQRGPTLVSLVFVYYLRLAPLVAEWLQPRGHHWLMSGPISLLIIFLEN